MTLPNFLGIGVPRAGTTWLHQQLASHPQVYVPSKRKEIHFFDRYYERGLQWYASFFPSENQAHEFHALGEITPHYLYCASCLERIMTVDSIDRFIVLLRNPIDRAFSHFLFRVRIENFSGGFDEFLTSNPEMLDWGYYSRYLSEYYQFFGREQILVLLYEEVFSNLDRAKSQLTRFFGLDPLGFSLSSDTKINASYVPRHRRSYAFAIKAARILRDRDVYRPIQWMKDLGVKRMFGKRKGPLPSMTEEVRTYLIALYRDEIAELESILQRDLTCWEDFGG